MERTLRFTVDEARMMHMCAELSGKPVHLHERPGENGTEVCAYSGVECGEWKLTRWAAMKNLRRALLATEKRDSQ